GLGPVNQRAINSAAFRQRGTRWFQAAPAAMLDRSTINCHPLRIVCRVERERGPAETMILIARPDVFEAMLGPTAGIMGLSQRLNDARANQHSCDVGQNKPQLNFHRHSPERVQSIHRINSSLFDQDPLASMV